MYIANFTPDTIEWQHVGVIGRLEPDDITEFDDARGKHILNKWGQRGLLRIEYGDQGNEAEKRKDAMNLYKRFWQKQLSYFNQHNESLKNENKPYVHPSVELETKAEEFGIELIGPWKMITPAAGANQKEVDSLKNDVAELKDMVKKLMGVTEDVTKQRDTALIDQFQELNGKSFREWMDANLSKIRSWPDHIQALVQAKWVATQGNEMYPLTS